LLRKLLDAQSHDAFKSHRAAVRDLFDDGLGEFITDRLTPEQAEQLLSILQREMGLEEHRKEPMRRIVLRKHAALREEEGEKLYTTAEGLERKRAEFENITRIEIPRNAEEIRKAAAHGDLRENFEYKAARDKHEMLSSRAKTLHDELARARVLEPAAIEPNRVRVGTTVLFKREDSKESKTLTILGPWDSDPAHGVVSYLAPAIQPVLGKAPGEAVQFQDGRWVVGTIRVWRDA
jgi:transcription elongation GreA/GreB family factor